MPATKILIVDDDESLRAIVRASLAAGGFTFTEAEGVETAWTAVQDEPPDLMVLDYQMPDGDGFSLLRRLRADQRFAQLPVVMLTGHDQVSRAMEGITAGASDYIVKPFDPDHLLERVRFQLDRGAHKDGSVIFPGSEG